MGMTCAILFVPLLAAAANPAPSDDVQALRREVDELRAEIQALRFALTEVARLDRQQADIVDRALRGQGEASKEPPPSAQEETGKRSQAPSLPKSAPRPGSGSGKDGSISGKVKVPSGEPVAYVYVENVTGQLVNGKKVQIEQSNKQFAPGWAVVEKGTTIEFPNQDNIYHNVFSRSSGNTFDLGLYRKGDSVKSHRFIKPGAVDVFCNIHPQMSANILVVPNRHFAKVQGDGSFVIENVPSGRRKVVAWSPGSNVASEWVEVAVDGTASVDLALQPKGSSHLNKDGRPYGSYP
jgi:plastocyanin